jgi:fucose permease
LLKLSTFTDEDIKRSFDSLKSDESDNVVNIDQGLRRLVFSSTEEVKTYDEFKGMKMVSLIANKNEKNKSIPTIAYDDYKKNILSLGEKLDNRVYPLGVSFLFTGTSLGIVIPCMPLLVTELSMPSSHFGVVIAAFGLARLIGNIPSGFLVEKYGRKAMLVSGQGMSAIGTGLIGLTLVPGFGTPWLVACRFVSGLGVAAFVAGSSALLFLQSFKVHCFAF